MIIGIWQVNYNFKKFISSLNILMFVSLLSQYYNKPTAV